MQLTPMDTNKLFETLSSFCPVSKNFRRALEKELSPLSLPQNYMLLEAPRVSDYLYFLETGFAMSYRYVAGKRVVENFWGSGQIVFSPRSFFGQVPSREFIQLLQSSEVLCVSYAGAKKLFRTYQEANTIQRMMLARCYEWEKERYRDLFELSTMERHRKVVSSYPGIEQVTAQENIASYLGITPQALSRAKKRHARN